MNLISWREEYLIGIPMIDNRHIQLVDIINSLNNAVVECRSQDTLESTFEQLHHYITEHFSEEEEFMKSINYPQLSQHIQIHNDFRAEIKEFYAKYKEGDSFAAMPFVMYLRDWFVNHICFRDSLIKPYIKNENS